MLIPNWQKSALYGTINKGVSIYDTSEHLKSLCRCSFKHNIQHVTLWLIFSAPTIHTNTCTFLVCVLRNKEFSNLSLEQSHKLSTFHKSETAKGFAIKLNSLTGLWSFSHNSVWSFSQNKMQIYLMKCFTYTYNDVHLSTIWLVNDNTKCPHDSLHNASFFLKFMLWNNLLRTTRL